ncbi:hypothetical protein NC653_037450 [Populus alba x Populus x berolinensis]|uniref:Uncharacterized protein n=1 Tax=Populus alba x Populus x berolinensis TaxID=444605 RepID=A0AAD6LDR7_9ROSI|nr:hypothetical protein NC653_037193 [Populus alba x Populus x berolinensis]KAJ6959154.1 hypothetical protein NC653_037450 [Populus alba x Populus x berolinensis]
MGCWVQMPLWSTLKATKTSNNQRNLYFPFETLEVEFYGFWWGTTEDTPTNFESTNRQQRPMIVIKKSMILSFSNPHLVAAAVALAAVEVVAAEADVAGTAAAAAAASGNEFGAVETVVQLRKYALLDYWGGIIAGLLQKMHSSSWVHHLVFDQSVPSDAEFLLSVRHSRLSQNKKSSLRPVTKEVESE